MKKLRVMECFAGIGACSKALERLNIPHEIVDAVEIDKYAIQSFNAIHGTNFEPQDITTWDKDIEIDLILGGFPCQDISLAGNSIVVNVLEAIFKELFSEYIPNLDKWSDLD